MNIEDFQKLRDKHFGELCQYFDNKELDKAEKFIDNNQYTLGFKRCGKAFVLSCQLGKMDMAKWLISLDKDNELCNCPITCKLVLTLSYEAGNIDIVMWFLSLDTKNGIRGDNDLTFRACCEFGFLELAKILLERYPDIDIHAKDDYAFKASCFSENYDVARWLNSLDPNLKILTRKNFIQQHSGKNRKK